MAAASAITAAIAIAMLCQAQIARADIYWADFDTNSIGRAYYSIPNNVGSIVTTDSFISTPNVSHPNGVAVDAGHIYWTNTQLSTGGSIGRANLDGTNPSLTFIQGLQAPRGIAIDGNYIYWANSGGNSIGRANLDGSNPNDFFIRNVNGPDGVAVDSQYIYWTSLGDQSIGRANLDGTNPDFTFIAGPTQPGATQPYRLTVDGNYVYWANQGGNLASTSIERAALSGLVAPSPLVTNINTVRGVAVDSNYVYWTDSAAIGRANLDGTGKTNLIAATGGPVALAVNGGGPPTSLSPPRITGAVSVGRTLSDSHGGWSANPTSFTYQWLRCDRAGANCVQVPFAVFGTYHLTSVDAGHTIGLQETAANAFGRNTSSASPTAVVPNYATMSTPTTTVGPRVVVTVACVGANGQTCSGSIYARVRVVKHGKATMVTVGKAPYAVRTGTQKTIQLDLNGTGKGLLARARGYRLPAHLVMTGTSKFTAKVVFRYARIIPKADVQAEFVPAPAGHFTVVNMLFAAPVPTAAHVSLICSGSGCPTIHRRTVRARKGRADFAGLFRGALLGPGATVEISITLPGTIGEVALFAGFGQGVHRVYLCLPPGYQRAVKCL